MDGQLVGWEDGQMNRWLDRWLDTVFRRINAPGAEARIEPLPLLDFNETRRVDY